MIDKIKDIVNKINTLLKENSKYKLNDALNGSMDDFIEVVKPSNDDYKVKYAKEKWWIFDNEDLEFETVESLFKRNITIEDEKGEEICYL